MWLMKVKESQQFQFFASYAIDIHTNEFLESGAKGCLMLKES